MTEPVKLLLLIAIAVAVGGALSGCNYVAPDIAVCLFTPASCN